MSDFTAEQLRELATEVGEQIAPLIGDAGGYCSMQTRIDIVLEAVFVKFIPFVRTQPRESVVEPSEEQTK